MIEVTDPIATVEAANVLFTKVLDNAETARGVGGTVTDELPEALTYVMTKLLF